MTLRKIFLASSLSAALALAAASPAAAQMTIAAGAAVTDPEGGAVGTITSVDGGNAVLRTDRHEVTLPLASFTATDDAILVGVTRAELNAQVDRMLAEAQAAIVVGATVRDRDGVLVGPIQALDDETITVQLGEQLIRLPRTGIAPGANGLVVGATVAELRAAAGGGASS